MARRRKKILDGLTAAEGQAVLRLLLERHPALVAEAETLAAKVASEVDRDAIADSVEAEVGLLGLDDLGARSGRQAFGYVEPGEAAWELLQEVVQGPQDDIVRLVGMGLEDGARATCEGVLLGLYRLDQQTGHEVLVYAEDFAAEAFADTLERWLTADGPMKGKRVLADEFVDRQIPEWGWLVDRVAGAAKGGKRR